MGGNGNRKKKVSIQTIEMLNTYVCVCVIPHLETITCAICEVEVGGFFLIHVGRGEDKKILNYFMRIIAVIVGFLYRILEFLRFFQFLMEIVLPSVTL